MNKDVSAPINDSEIMVKRDENGRIKPGSVLNPNGKPKGTKHLSTILSESLQEASGKGDITNQEVIIQKVMDMAKSGDIRAIELVWNRIEGKSPLVLEQNFPQPIMGFSVNLNTERE
jgi:hypothetical protein